MRRQRKPVPKLRSDLSYRDGLIDFLDRAGWNATALVQNVLSEHAHELAEQQRAWDGLSMTMCGRAMVPLDMLADSIDPEVQK